MKKIILLSVILCLSYSCKKDRTCSCTEASTVINPSGTHSSTQNYDVVFVKSKKRPAKWACAHIRETDVNNGNTQTSFDRDCKLK